MRRIYYNEYHAHGEKGKKVKKNGNKIMKNSGMFGWNLLWKQTIKNPVMLG